MYAGRQYNATASSLERHPFECAKCKHQAMVVIVGLGVGSGASPLFLDNDGAQQRAQRAAKKDAQLDIQRTLATVACPECGHIDPAARAAVWRRALFSAVGICAGGAVLAALATSGNVVSMYVGAGVGLVAGVITAIVLILKKNPVVFESTPGR